MSGRSVRGFLMLASLFAVGYWIHEKRPTVSGLIDDLTRPIIGSRAAVSESERKRVVGEAGQVVAAGEEKPVGALYEGMSEDDVRRVLGEPDVIERLEDESGDRVRWTYRSASRAILIKNHRVASITVP
jgi:hypothetical protein